MKKLSERIKSLRMDGETQTEFAQRLGTTQASISRYLNGRQPDRETLIKIARRAGVSLDWLLTGSGKSGKVPVPKGKNDEVLLQAVLAYLGEIGSVSQKEKDRIIHMVGSIMTDKDSRKALIAFWESREAKKK